MKLKITFKCLDTGETGSVNLDLKSYDEVNVRDLKLEIQTLLQVPVCDQKLIFQERLLSVDSLYLKELYLRENDEFYLEFLAKANIEGLDKAINEIKHFQQKVVHSLQPEEFVYRDFVYLRPAIQGVRCGALNSLTFHYFTPWKQGRALAHRHYFVQEGGFDALMEVLRFSQKLCTIPDDKIPQNRRGIRNLFQLFSDQHLELQIHCLSVLWNFLAAAEDRQLGLQKGGLALAINSLLVNPHEHGTHNIGLNRKRLRINGNAVGCVAGFVAYDADARRTVASNKPLIKKVLDMLIEGDVNQRIFSRQLVIYVLFYCSYDAIALENLVKENVHLKVMQFLMKRLQDNSGDIVLRYYSCLFLARARTARRFSLSHSLERLVDSVLLDRFLPMHTPNQIADWEEKHSCVWITLKPLVHVAFAGGERSRNTVSASACVWDLLFGDDIPVGRLDRHDDEENKEKIDARNVLGISTFSPPLEDDCNIFSLVKQGEASPRLKWPGSLSVQRLGVFAIQHLLFSSGNRELILSENLLEYLVCLQWQLREEERVILKAELMDKFGPVNPPSLRVLSKSVLAQIYGFDAVVRF